MPLQIMAPLRSAQLLQPYAKYLYIQIVQNAKGRNSVISLQLQFLPLEAVDSENVSFPASLITSPPGFGEYGGRQQVSETASNQISWLSFQLQATTTHSSPCIFEGTWLTCFLQEPYGTTSFIYLKCLYSLITIVLLTYINIQDILLNCSVNTIPL